MKATGGPETLKRLLDVADRLERLRRRLVGRGEVPEGAAARSLRDEGRRWVRDLLAPATETAAAPVAGTFGRLLRRFRFDEEQTTILLLLLRRRIEGDRDSLSGREILSFLFEGSYDRLRGLRLLAPRGVLLRSGVVSTRGPSADPLERQYALSPRFFRALQRDVAPELRMRERWRSTPYPGAREYLLAWGRLARLYQRRAHLVFGAGGDPADAAESEEVHRLSARIRRDRLRIARRRKITPGSRGFPLVEFVEEHGLDDKETVVVVAMLFQDVHAGASFMDGVEVVKLVSASEEELFANRRLLDPNARLLRDGILQLGEPESEDEPALAREAYLAPGLIAELLAGTSDPLPIDPEMRQEWRDFLSSLDSTDEFELGGSS